MPRVQELPVEGEEDTMVDTDEVVSTDPDNPGPRKHRPVVEQEAAWIRDLGKQSRHPWKPKGGATLIAGELRSMVVEFGGYALDKTHSRLEVEVGPFSLGNPPVHLGKFRLAIRLDNLWQSESRHDCDLGAVLVATAMTPNPAAGKPDTTHPHVQGGHVCIGSAESPMKNALKDGRLCDAFLVAEGVLNNYNSRSPFHTLETWRGEQCADCRGLREHGTTAPCSFSGCQLRRLCRLCRVECRTCARSRCAGHVLTCKFPGCNRKFCNQRCLGNGCRGCKALMCNSHMTQCGTCRLFSCKECLKTQCQKCKAEGCGGCQKISPCAGCKTVGCAKCLVEDTGLRVVDSSNGVALLAPYVATAAQMSVITAGKTDRWCSDCKGRCSVCLGTTGIEMLDSDSRCKGCVWRADHPLPTPPIPQSWEVPPALAAGSPLRPVAPPPPLPSTERSSTMPGTVPQITWSGPTIPIPEMTPPLPNPYELTLPGPTVGSRLDPFDMAVPAEASQTPPHPQGETHES